MENKDEKDNKMSNEAKAIEQAKKYAVRCIEIPPHARFEIRWSTVSPDNNTVEQELDGLYKDSGPMLIACLTD